MARPEAEPKTPLAARLRDFRRRLGDPDREEFARAIGVSKSALASYERGESEPTATALAAYREQFGANLVWIISDLGEMFEDPNKVPTPTHGYDVMLLAKLGDAVQAVFLQAKQTAPPRAITTEAGKLYNELLGMVKDIKDEEVVEAMIPVLRERFKARIEKAEPGAGKRSA